jgi:phosphoribosylformimino-5-aminoimidazole carboxamide ribotide isomerase
MLILPAIDLKDGRCVRLTQGRFDAATLYGDPFAQLDAFAAAGAAWAHVVDLDGARWGAPEQHGIIAKLARSNEIKLQAGGGIRTRGHVAQLIDAGVARVVVGSTAARDPDAVMRWLDEFGPERICCAFDLRATGAQGASEVAIEGWTSGGGLTLADALDNYRSSTLQHVLITDIARDGMLAGPNVALICALATERPDLSVQASGGVASLQDLAALRQAGAAAAIIGRALYERCFALGDALAG